jgi:hypothetical protein
VPQPLIRIKETGLFAIAASTSEAISESLHQLRRYRFCEVSPWRPPHNHARAACNALNSGEIKPVRYPAYNS